MPMSAARSSRRPAVAIVSDPERRGGEPIIAGTSVRVYDVAVPYERFGMAPEEIAAALPHLDLARIHCALSYYYLHKATLDAQWRAAERRVARSRRGRPSLMEQARGRAAALSR
ncbi:MAG: DUF433 domain-containing protein [bacterium]